MKTKFYLFVALICIAPILWGSSSLAQKSAEVIQVSSQFPSTPPDPLIYQAFEAVNLPVEGSLPTPKTFFSTQVFLPKDIPKEESHFLQAFTFFDSHSPTISKECVFKKDNRVLAGFRAVLLNQKEPLTQKSLLLEGKEHYLYSNASKTFVYTQEQSASDQKVRLKEWIKAYTPDNKSSLSFKWKLSSRMDSTDIVLKPLPGGSVGIYHKINFSEPNPVKRESFIEKVRQALRKVCPTMNVEDQPFATLEPAVYWTQEGVKKIAPYTLSKNNEVTVNIQEPMSSYPLLIDPTVAWGQWLGGTGNDVVYAMAVTGDEIYAGGLSQATASWETITTTQGTFGGSEEGFVIEIADGASPSLTWRQWLGSNDSDQIRALAVTADEIYAGGVSYSTASWETITVTQGTHNGASYGEGFVIEIADAATPSLAWRQWLGGTEGASLLALAVNGNEIYAGGSTTVSNSWEGTFQGTNAGGGYMEGFVVEIADGATPTVAWGQWLGGADSDEVTGLAVDSDEIYAGGWSLSSSSWETVTFQGAFNAAYAEGFVIEIADNTTPSLAWGHWLGGSWEDYVYGVAVNGDEIYAMGYTSVNGSTDWEVTPSGTFAGQELFLVELADNTTPSIAWAQWIGGISYDYPYGIAINGDEIYVAGTTTNSSSWEVTPSGTFSGTIEAFLVEVTDGPTVSWGQWLGGNTGDYEYIYALAINGDEIYAGGFSDNSSSWEVTFSGSLGGAPNYEGFGAEISDDVVTSAIKTINGLAIASVNTVKGLARASVKTVDGLA